MYIFIFKTVFSISLMLSSKIILRVLDVLGEGSKMVWDRIGPTSHIIIFRYNLLRYFSSFTSTILNFTYSNAN
jgi:hypothetical protein